MGKSRGLGKGLDAIFTESEPVEDAGVRETDSLVRMVRVSDLEPDRDQPRKVFEPESLASLADSIARHGVLQPLVVRRITAVGEPADSPAAKILADKYSIVSGERRWRAAKMAGLAQVPVVVKELDGKDAAAVMLVENLQREDLTPVEQARGLLRLVEEFGLTQEEAASMVGISRSALTNALRLLHLPAKTLELLEHGAISAGHARALLAAKESDAIDALAQEIVKRGLNVRQAERLVKAFCSRQASPAEAVSTASERAYMQTLQERVSTTLGRRAVIKADRKSPEKGVLHLEYYGNDDLERLLLSLCGKDLFEEK